MNITRRGAISYLTAPFIAARAAGEDGFREPEYPSSVRLSEQFRIRARKEASASGVERGLYGSFGSIDRRYLSVLPPDGNSMSWSGTGWRGERVHAQLVLWTATGAHAVHYRVTPLSTPGGAEIPPAHVKATFVRYVLADGGWPRNTCRALPGAPLVHVPDILDPVARLDLPPTSARPIWIALDIPRSAAPGRYRGQVIVSYEGGEPLTFDLTLEVLPMTLPPPSEWSFHLDLWQDPDVVARYHHVPLWSDQHWRALEPLWRMLADAGQKCVTASIVEEPWGSTGYHPFRSMVRWARRKDGNWSFDYNIFDRYVEFCERVGIAKQINCYSMAPRFGAQYFDELAGEVKVLKAGVGSEEFARHWGPFLRDFSQHLAARGWLQRTVIALDETGLDTVRKIGAFLKETAPGLKLAWAGKCPPDLDFDIYDISTHLKTPLPAEFLKKRAARGQLTTIYVSCESPSANTFISSDPAEAAWLGWYAAAGSYNGFLRWAYNGWVADRWGYNPAADPLYDTRTYALPSGDPFLVYPGPRSSIRFERLREGIQDFEKIRILRSALSKSAEPQARNKLKALDELLGRFLEPPAKQPPFDELVRDGKQLLVELARYAAPSA